MSNLELYMVKEKTENERVVSKLDEVGIDYQTVNVPKDRKSRDEIEYVIYHVVDGILEFL